MPFTLAHPAAVVFIARGPLSMLALISGAVAPDVPYFLRLLPLDVTAESWYEPFVNATSSHSFTYLFSVALPLALVVYLAGLFVVPPLRTAVGIESPPKSKLSFNRVVSRGSWIVISLLIGVATHVVWDFMVELGGVATPYLQHGSTALGLLVLVVFVIHRRTAISAHEPVVRRNLKVITSAGMIFAVLGAAVTAWAWLDPEPGLSSNEVLAGVTTDAAKGAIAGLVTAAAILTVAWWTKQASTAAAHRLK